MSERTCSIEGCERPARSRGWCNLHYLRWAKNGDPLITRQPRRGGARPVCTVNGCDRPLWVTGMCQMHYTRNARHGDPTTTLHPGRKVRADGYIQLYRPEHPIAMGGGYVFEHRMVAYDAGILHDLTDHVHHRNGDKADNRPENLEAMSNAEHQRLHQHHPAS
jgi:HNH endonuclease